MADRALTSRFELKFWLPPDQLLAVRRSIRPFVRPDRHAALCPGFRYRLCSLYLDDSDLTLCRTTEEGHRNRFKLRVRSYSDRDTDPVYFEIKRRVDQVVRKTRARTDRALALRLLEGAALHEAGDSPQLAEFFQLARRIAARPVLRVRYEREAYESRGRDPLRITLDTCLEHAATPSAALSMSGHGWRETPTEGAILEVKFTNTCPAWVAGLVRSLNLERRSIPKYVLSVGRARALGTLRHAALARTVHPPAVFRS